MTPSTGYWINLRNLPAKLGTKRSVHGDGLIDSTCRGHQNSVDSRLVHAAAQGVYDLLANASGTQ